MRSASDVAGLLDRFSLEGRVAVVTGASSGLGVAIAVGLAEAGADVVLGARRADGLAQTSALVKAAGSRCVTRPTDVTDPTSCQALADEAVDAFGRLDILVNNAGVAIAVPASREKPQQFRQVLDTNLCGAYWMAQSCARLMAPGSSIVNIGSAFALTSGGLPQAAYTASKAGLLGLTRDLAQQWTGRKGIRVNALAPGFFRTEMAEQFPAGYVESMIQRRVVAGREGDAAELAAAVVFLASDAAAYITGAVLPVDGGLLLT